jgi:hypothetical protein
MTLLGTVCEPLMLHLMEGPLVVPFWVPAVVGFHGVEVEVGSLVAGEGFVVGSLHEKRLHGDLNGTDGDRMGTDA